MLGTITAILAALSTPAKWAADAFTKWQDRRSQVEEAKLQTELATLKAKAELAAYKVKSDLEWDLTWAGQAQSSWKDEYILILWSIPFLTVVLAFVGAIIFPSQRDSFVTTLQFIGQTIGQDGISWYLSGWGIIFAATFGLKGALQYMVPGKVSKIVDAFKDIPDDIPPEAAQSVSEDTREKLKGKVGLF